MPLSEQEQRLLEEMERSLYHNDADYVSGTSGRSVRATYSSLVIGVLVGVVGVATLVAGAGLRLPVVGVLGFILMFAGVLVIFTPRRGGQAAHEQGGTSRTDDASHRGESAPRWDDRPDNRDE